MTNETEQIIMEDPVKLKVGDNSRFRTDANLSELMESVKQNGILQPIVARFEDKKVICGNRRLAAAVKLELSSVPVRYLKGINDKQVEILNLLENIQRKDISSIEIGRKVDSLLKNTSFKISITEIATSLGMSVNRIKVCLFAFKALPEKFRDKMVHLINSQHKKYGELSENLIFSILNFSRLYKVINNKELNLFLEEALEEKLTIGQVNLIGKLYTSGMPFKLALKEVKNYTILRVDLPALKTELASVQKKEGIFTKNDLICKIIREKYPNLIY